jgi:hypothetical protein
MPITAASVRFAQRSRLFKIRTDSQVQVATKAIAMSGKTKSA